MVDVAHQTVFIKPLALNSTPWRTLDKTSCIKKSSAYIFSENRNSVFSIDLRPWTNFHFMSFLFDYIDESQWIE